MVVHERQLTAQLVTHERANDGEAGAVLRGLHAVAVVGDREHDFTVAQKLAWVMMGGDTSPNVAVSEQYILDLEREAFMWLAGTEKTQARMQYMLMNNKPLRN